MNNHHYAREAKLASPGLFHEAGTALVLVAQRALGRPAVYGIPFSIPAFQLGETVYRSPHPERSLSRAAAAALLATHQASESEAKVRKANAKELLAAIADNRQLVAISVDREATPGYLRLPLRVNRGLAAFKSESRARALGIAPSYPLSLADLPQLAARRDGPERAWPGARILVRELVTLPTHSRLRPEELKELAEMLGALRG
jgi:hypothetical protein